MNESISAPERNPAVQRCLDALEQAFAMGRARNIAGYQLRKLCYNAYREAMPDLTSRENAIGFIACVGRGMLIDAILASDGTKLLYAAQIALTSFPREAKS